MEQQTNTHRFPFGRRQQLAVPTEIVNCGTFDAKGADHLAQPAQLQDLARDQVVSLLFRLVA